ncbi:hypothetical protein DL89DRAFT_135379 [Linderina pennispora]|uniref:Uncharacterized protein n=1 Tax=Linderina pennispora TaxID=61395 RepID=A0A1Y1WAE6_9FUNG|nr:uncharacterized protein DL89DRAFT_135379 [Linderina pennispora]ORX70517.1 hypothetical protein DL89DRAFT_135379 [Linderina pennispora]
MPRSLLTSPPPGSHKPCRQPSRPCHTQTAKVADGGGAGAGAGGLCLPLVMCLQGQSQRTEIGPEGTTKWNKNTRPLPKKGARNMQTQILSESRADLPELLAPHYTPPLSLTALDIGRTDHFSLIFHLPKKTPLMVGRYRSEQVCGGATNIAKTVPFSVYAH